MGARHQKELPFFDVPKDKWFNDGLRTLFIACRGMDGAEIADEIVGEASTTVKLVGQPNQSQSSVLKDHIERGTVSLG